MPPCLTIGLRWLPVEVKAGLNNINDIANESQALFTTHIICHLLLEEDKAE